MDSDFFCPHQEKKIRDFAPFEIEHKQDDENQANPYHPKHAV